MSRFTRYDGERRSRSPRDRSADRYNDRGSQYGDNDRRRLSGESRPNQSGYQGNRDNFRESLTGREPPRGPKALLDPPSGPRGSGYPSDFRGRGRGGRGRGWRDDSRDRGRDRDDFRDRRDGPPFRDDRSRERDRDWRERERDSFRGRRPSPPMRGRSPTRDFRDRDIPLGVDADRARRGSRDGPLSAGSSSSDPVFASQSYRGGFGRGRGGRGRGDWADRGRGRGGYYEDRDQRYPRSRSQEGRWGRNDRDERDVHRYLDPDPRARDPRDDRDLRDREPVRPKPERASVSREPPAATKDVSPPPVAPSAPAFGSVPSRNPSSADIQSLTGKAPPTGPRALTDERLAAGAPAAPAAETRPPPTGPARAATQDGSHPIPIGPRAQMQKQQRPSSKQWINPSLNPKKGPESPKVARSQSFVSQQSRPFGARPGSSGSDFQTDLSRRPRSSDSKAESHGDAADARRHSSSMTEPGEITEDIAPPPIRRSVDLEMKDATLYHNFKSDHRGVDVPRHDTKSISSHGKPTSPTLTKLVSARPTNGSATIRGQDLDGSRKRHKPCVIHAPIQEIPGLSKGPLPIDQGDSDDDEDIDDYFNMEISKAQTELEKLQGEDTTYLQSLIFRAGLAEGTFAFNALQDTGGLLSVLEPIPEDVEFPRKESAAPQDKQTRSRPSTATTQHSADGSFTARGQLEGEPGEKTAVGSEPQPKIEEIDGGVPHLPLPTVEKDDTRHEDEDVPMQDVAGPTEVRKSASRLRTVDQEDGVLGLGRLPAVGGQQSPMPSHADEEDDDATEIDEVDDTVIAMVRQYMKTPPADDLPDYSCTPWYGDKQYLKSEAPSAAVNAFILKAMKQEYDVRKIEQEAAGADYAAKYRFYLQYTLSDDPTAAKSREKFSGGVPIAEPNGVHHLPAESKPEGRSTGRRFASERDLERILQESRRQEEERREREERAQREKYTSEKEADIPEMYWTDDDRLRDLYIDRTGQRLVEKLVESWELMPPIINFTEEEAALYEKAYLEFPKQWGRIAEQIPNRDFHDCIQYYYSKKRDLNLKEKLKRQPRKRKKGSRKQRSSALVSELGNGENETEENHETGENGERRRPRRAAAPTFSFEATPAADSDGNTPAGTPGRRRGAANDSKNDSGAEKPEGGRKGRKRVAREKEPKQPKQAAQTLVPTPPSAVKAGRPRSNSRAQVPDLTSSQPPTEGTPLSTQFEVPPPGIQAPSGGPPVLGPDRAIPIASSSISEVMAPPSLRPEPPMPQAAVPTFDLSQPDRTRTPQQASSYWSVSESTDFPDLLRSFGTDWTSIAGHMQTKTAVMVKNYYVRQKDGGKTEWEKIATEADSKKARGEHLPVPPTPNSRPMKRYEGPHSAPRPLAAADSLEEAIASKSGASPSQGLGQAFSRFQVPVAIAQAPSGQAPLSQPGAPPMSAQQGSPRLTSQAMSPTVHPLRAPIAQFAYPDRDADTGLLPQNRAAQKQAPAPAAENMQQRPLAWTNDVDAQLQSLAQRQAQRQMQQQREEPRQVDQTRLKQEPDVSPSHETFAPQAPVRGAPLRSEPFAGGRSRATIPPSQAYPSAVQQSSMRSLMSEPVTTPQAPIHRSTPSESYGAMPPQAPTPQARAPEPARRSNLMALLNDDPPPKRVSDVSSASIKPSPTPPPMSARGPPAAPASQLRREPEPSSYSPYSRNPPPQSSMPSLKPYSNQSPQPQQMNPQRPPIISPVESGAAERDFYARHPYQPQHQGPPSNSPQIHHYPSPGQQPQMSYQGQPPNYSPYGPVSSQPHSASPTLQYAGHPTSASGRRDQLPSGRENAWPTPDTRGPPQQNPWPQNAPPPKNNQPPAQSAWGAQHGGPPKPAPGGGPMPPQPSWVSGAPSQPPPHHMGMRDERGYPMHDARGQHQHSHSLSGRYTPGPRPGEGPPPPPPSQPAYPRYTNTPGPQQGRDPRDPGGPPRSYTPVAPYDNRPPPPQGPYGSQDPRDAQMRDPRGDPNQAPGILQRTLRPHEDYGRAPPDRYR